MKLIGSPNPPAALLLGSDAVTFVKEKLERMAADIKTWETVSRSTDVQ